MKYKPIYSLYCSKEGSSFGKISIWYRRSREFKWAFLRRADLSRSFNKTDVLEIAGTDRVLLTLLQPPNT